MGQPAVAGAEATASRGRAASPPERKPRTDATGLATTRWLCAAVTLDPELERRVLDEVLEEQQRAVVTTPGVDLVTVLKYALAAHRRRVIRDIILLVDLLALILTVIFFRSFPLFVVLLLAAWVTVFTHRFIGQYGPVISGLRPGRFDPRKVNSPPPDSFAGRRFQRIAAAGTTGNVTLYSGFAPFRGYGTARSNWSFAVDITRAPASMTRPGQRGQPKAFSALDVYDSVKAGLRGLDLPGIELTDRLFVNGRDIHDDRRFLPEPGGAPRYVGPVPLEYSIAWLICAVTCGREAVMVGWPGAAQDHLLDSPPRSRPRPPGVPQGPGQGG